MRGNQEGRGVGHPKFRWTCECGQTGWGPGGRGGRMQSNRVRFPRAAAKNSPHAKCGMAPNALQQPPALPRSTRPWQPGPRPCCNTGRPPSKRLGVGDTQPG
eukprot:3368546-Lingulodinium_polyedra.AAC.1